MILGRVLYGKKQYNTRLGVYGVWLQFFPFECNVNEALQPSAFSLQPSALFMRPGTRDGG